MKTFRCIKIEKHFILLGVLVLVFVFVGASYFSNISSSTISTHADQNYKEEGHIDDEKEESEDADDIDDVLLQDDDINQPWSFEGKDDFFIEYRLERERVRSRELDLLQQMINNPNVSEEAKLNAENKLLDIKEMMELELNVENSLKALGYPNAIMFIRENNVNVVINAEALTREELAKISEVVASSTGVARHQITITEKDGA
ncbi:SpoIIIAH-like family protein [Proteinivorax hydrogeniformans]|uniref:SpoIIIAH-like family protein n=1 Tax=Proteinivorax hydrogeniformans TaxID=1826727 RepID=A0AAU8HQG2_9FIRM